MPTTFCPCCCGSGKACYQEWFTVWNCETETFATPAEDNKLCLDPADALTTWTKDGEDASGCTYKIHVPMNKCCSVNGDCSSEPTTAAPAVPGSAPTDCCNCLGEDCLQVTGTCGLCSITPEFPSQWIAIVSGVTAVCDGASRVDLMNGTYTMAGGDSCIWNVAAPVPTHKLHSDPGTCAVVTNTYNNFNATLQPHSAGFMRFDLRDNVLSFGKTGGASAIFAIPDNFCCSPITASLSDHRGCSGGTVTLYPCASP